MALNDSAKAGKTRLNPQDEVLDGYKKRFDLKQSEADNLHMFFSPSRIPKGLTEKEVRIAVKLYPFREAERHAEVHAGQLAPSFLPKGLSFNRKRMTRKNFNAGIIKFLERVSAVQK